MSSPCATFSLPEVLLRMIPGWLLSPIVVSSLVWKEDGVGVQRQKAPNMDSDEFKEIVARHYEPLYRFACALTGAEADAGDLTQQAFYAWATKGHQLRERSKVKAWLFTTLHRAFLQTRRKQNRFPHYGLDEVAPEDLSASSSASGDPIDSAQAVRALSHVDEIYRAAVSLFYLEDCSYREIAQILQVAEGTVKSRIARGILQLRRLLGCTTSRRFDRESCMPGDEADLDQPKALTL